jgi:hypothetical protein
MNLPLLSNFLIDLNPKGLLLSLSPSTDDNGTKDTTTDEVNAIIITIIEILTRAFFAPSLFIFIYIIFFTHTKLNNMIRLLKD